MIYDVVFIDSEGKRQVEQWEGSNPGMAFAKCLKKHSGVKLISGHVYRKAAGGCEMWMDYEPPSVIKVTPLPAEKRVQVEMNLG